MSQPPKLDFMSIKAMTPSKIVATKAALNLIARVPQNEVRRMLDMLGLLPILLKS